MPKPQNKTFSKSKKLNTIKDSIPDSEKEKKAITYNSKQAKIIALIQRPSGATLQELVSATNWQKHSVRGTISGALKKRLKLPIISEQEKRGRIYRIAGDQA